MNFIQSTFKYIKSLYQSKDSDKRIGTYFATFLALILIVWVVTGSYESKPAQEDKQDSEVTQDEGTDSISNIRYIKSKAITRNQTINRSGTTYSKSNINVVAKRSGEIIKIGAKEGQFVEKGELLFALDARDLPARKKQLEANLKRLELQQQSSKALTEKGLQSELSQIASDASIVDINAQITLLELDIEASEIRSPVRGFYQKAFLSQGSFANYGAKAANILVLDPLIVRISLSQEEIQNLQSSGTNQATVTVNNKKLPAKIIRTSSEADQATRSFEIELEISNPKNSIKAGFSATVELQLKPEPYHAFKSSWLTLGENGNLGIKYIDNDGFVRFQSVDIGNTEGDITWVSGLPQEVQVITLGQEVAVINSTAEAKIDDRY